ncbi:hypothetical protein K1T71_002699 [Dendrolimus kikuchii]|uniref:Uncharacterized protein n=1 Tax=Dendrolimus kikuchii TaxID=765133 RepID=A0ACC1DEF1_9NEOP|nr:hypothetical protein K1T71_002699 [Dendrolimus kikuchii]
MSKIQSIFQRIENLTKEDGQNELVSIYVKRSPGHGQSVLEEKADNSYEILNTFLNKIFHNIDDLGLEIKNDSRILISVKNQKLLRTCFQLVTSLGVSPCLIPGLGINLAKRCSLLHIISSIVLRDEQKYKILVACTDFFARSYQIPVLKNIIITLHLTDYLAALIQLSFAPFKKPGIYPNFIMTQEMYDELSLERQRYLNLYTHLVNNCFQPILMKELLVLQSVTDPPPPKFVKQVIANEMSKRLLIPGGLLSLIRCFIESYNIDTGFEWKKINMICKIVAAKHGKGSDGDYLVNICTQLSHILSLHNTHYLATAVACVLCLNEKYPDNSVVKDLVNSIFLSFVYNNLVNDINLPGTIILSPQDIDHKVNILHACTFTTHIDCPADLLIPNLDVLFLIGASSTKNEDMKFKLKDIITKILEKVNKDNFADIIKTFLFGKYKNFAKGLIAEEYDAGVAIKLINSPLQYDTEKCFYYLCDIFKALADNNSVEKFFEASLLILIEITAKRQKKCKKDLLLAIKDEPSFLDTVDEQYAVILQLLSEMATSLKVINVLKTNPSIVIKFIEFFLIQSNNKSNEECVAIALVLLNTILSNTNKINELEINVIKLSSELRRMSIDSNFNQILAKEALSLLNSELPQKKETACEKAISDVFDDLLPVRAHGIIELTKLIDLKDPESLSKKHYIFCVFQEQLKDPDSYIYLAAINGLASLCTHCTEDVLQVLCKEFLQVSNENTSIDTSDAENNLAKLKMKVGDVIVKVTKRIGEMAVVHKTILLNTTLCACRDEDPLIRTSALSNLAEIALVLHYKIGTIIYEVLLCIWSIIETDKAIECRRAAVMVIASLIKGLGKETLVKLKENLLPIYRTLKELYKNPTEDPVLKLHAQIALEELNDIVQDFLFPEMKMEKRIFVLDKPNDMQ